MLSVFKASERTVSTGALVLAFAFWAAREASAEPEALVSQSEVPTMLSDDGVVTPVNKLLPRSDQSFADWLWSLPVLYSNPEGKILQDFRLTGLYQGQYGNVNADQGSASGWENRREKFGVRIEFLKDFVFQANAQGSLTNGNQDTNNWDDVWLSWRRSEAFGLKIGQQKAFYTEEYSTSSRFIKTAERSLLVNQLAPGRAVGLYGSGQLEKWAYGLGAFFGAIGEGEGTNEGQFFLLNLGHDIKAVLPWAETSHLRLDYIYNDDSEQITTYPFGHAFSLSSILDTGKFRFMTNGIFATGKEDLSNVWGIIIMPSWEVIENKLELVARYQFAKGGANSLNLLSRYEQEVVPPPSDLGHRYNAIYGGVNYFINGQKLKLMAGLEYANMKDKANDGGAYNGWTFYGALRVYF